MKGFLLDTNVFNHLAEGKLTKADLPTGLPFFVTHLQHDEIMKCSDPHKRAELSTWLKTIVNHQEPTNSLVLGVSRVGACRIGAAVTFHKILKKLNAKKKRKSNANTHDALIGELAIEGGFVLVTNDQDLGEIVKSLGGYVRDLVRPIRK